MVSSFSYAIFPPDLWKSHGCAPNYLGPHLMFLLAPHISISNQYINLAISLVLPFARVTNCSLRCGRMGNGGKWKIPKTIYVARHCSFSQSHSVEYKKNHGIAIVFFDYILVDLVPRSMYKWNHARCVCATNSNSIICIYNIFRTTCQFVYSTIIPYNV